MHLSYIILWGTGLKMASFLMVSIFDQNIFPSPKIMYGIKHELLTMHQNRLNDLSIILYADYKRHESKKSSALHLDKSVMICPVCMLMSFVMTKGTAKWNQKGGIHKLRWKNFKYFAPFPLRWQVYYMLIYVVSLTFEWQPLPTCLST